ncbi:MAG: hypothetical protein RR444_07430 [Oscillospiraceae bacterium]
MATLNQNTTTATNTATTAQSTVASAIANVATNNGAAENIAKKAISAARCTSPADLFSIATAITILFARELNKKQLETLINLVALILAGLSAIVTQQQICLGEEIQPPI